MTQPESGFPLTVEALSTAINALRTAHSACEHRFCPWPGAWSEDDIADLAQTLGQAGYTLVRRS